MSINLTVPQTMQELRPRITVIGVGGAGCNAVNNMINADLDGVDFLVANTDGQALAHSLAPRKIQLGTNLTAGLGAGSKPDIGRQAAEESLDEVLAELSDCNMVFITAGMGGGTGTGAAPVIARAAREQGILTVGVVTKPFEFEGPRRMKQAATGIEQLAAHVDTLIVVPNQNLFHVANDRTTFADAFHMADDVLYQGVSGVTDLMLKPGLVNLDFADIRTVMTEMGKAMMGTGEASGENRAIEAAETAINNPLLEDSSLAGAKSLIVNVKGGPELGFYEVDEAVQRIRREVDEDANLVFGSAMDDSLEGTIRVSVVATGIDTLAANAALPRPKTTWSGAPEAASKVVASEASDTPVSEPTSNIKLPASQAEQPAEPASTIDGAMPDMAARLDSDGPVNMGDVPEGLFTPPADQHISAEQVDNQGELAERESIQADSPSTGAEQLDLEEAVANSEESAPSHAQSNDVAPTANAQEKSKDDTFFISAPVVGAEPATLAQAEPIQPARRSIFAQVAGMWKSDNNAAIAKEEAPQVSEETEIVNLSRGDALQESLPIGNQDHAAKDDADDDLDIPAFLRRQAN